jgi:hypothetical protein
MKLNGIAFALDATTFVIIGAVIVLTFVMIIILAKYLASDSPDA